MNMDIGESCLEKGARNAYVIPWELNTQTVTMLLVTACVSQGWEDQVVMPVLWDIGAFHIEDARNVNPVKSLAMSVIPTLEDVSVLCLQKVRLVSVVKLEPGTMTRIRDARNVVVTQLVLLGDNVMLKVVTVDV